MIEVPALAEARTARLSWFEPDPGVPTNYWALVLESKDRPIAIRWPLELPQSIDDAIATLGAALEVHYHLAPAPRPSEPDVAAWEISLRARSRVPRNEHDEIGR